VQRKNWKHPKNRLSLLKKTRETLTDNDICILEMFYVSLLYNGSLQYAKKNLNKKPVLKKIRLDWYDLKNSCPISFHLECSASTLKFQPWAPINLGTFGKLECLSEMGNFTKMHHFGWECQKKFNAHFGLGKTWMDL